MRLNASLTFDGRCADAMAFYAGVLGGTITFSQRFKDSPMAGDVPAAWGDRIVHATLALPDGSVLMGNDAFPDAYRGPQGFALVLHLPDPVAAARQFEALAEGGAVTLSLQPTFWSAAFGLLLDRFGVPWQINCEQPPPDVDDQREAR